MKLPTLIAPVLAFTASTLACLHVYGSIASNTVLGPSVWEVFAVEDS
jgi:hypothetical protein